MSVPSRFFYVERVQKSKQCKFLNEDIHMQASGVNLKLYQGDL